MPHALSLLWLAATLSLGCAALSKKKVVDHCDAVLLDQNETGLDVRTLVVQSAGGARSLVLTSQNDTSKPCKVVWWLEHNPQGMVKCLGSAPTKTGDSCAHAQCQVDPLDITLGYVCTMLASAVFSPAPRQDTKKLSTLCIGMGCRSSITRAPFPHSFLQSQTAPERPDRHWLPRAQRPGAQILVIGLGSSTLALWLRRQLPDVELHVAELLPGVVQAAPCFGLNVNDPKLHLHVSDGRAFLQHSADGQFDAILIDAFDTTASLPACFRTQEFFALAKRKLAPGGAMSFNLLENEESKRVLKSLSSNFETGQVWIGAAPGAEGIQEVVTAFNPGRSSEGRASEAPAPAKDWYDAASYRLVSEHALSGITSFDDSSECPHRTTA